MTRAERKKARNEMFARMEIIKRQRADQQTKFEKEHPILSGKIPITDYVAPRGNYFSGLGVNGYVAAKLRANKNFRA